MIKRFLGFVKAFRDKDPLYVCPKAKKCSYLDGPYCDVDTCRMKEDNTW